MTHRTATATANQVLAKVLPDNIDRQHRYERVGHIAHVNLREEALPYRYVIGAVILEKTPGLRTVVNKVG